MMKHPIKITKEWCLKMANLEGDAVIGAGVPSAFASDFKSTIWHRLGFGHAYVPPSDEEEGPDGRLKDGLLATSLVTDTHVHFDLVDRLRILVTGRVHVFVRTRSERDPGRAVSQSAVRVKGWGWQ